MGKLVVRLGALGLALGIPSWLGCTVTQAANPVPTQSLEIAEICLVENPAVRSEFLAALRSSLQRKGFEVRLLAPTAAPAECPVSATYLAKWSWDFVPYMATGEIVVFQNRLRTGDAVYSAPRGGWSLTTKIYAATEEKVATMVEQLFPGQR